MLRRLRPPDTVQPIFALEFFPKNRFLLSCIFFLLCFCLDPKAPKDQALRKERKQCDCAGLRPAKTEYRGIQIVINHRCAQRTANPHCTGGGNGSDKGGNARSGSAKQSSLLCPLSENRRPIPTEVPCGHFWRHLLVPKGGKSAPRRKNRIEGEGILPEESIGKFFLLKILFFVLLVRSKWGKCLLLHSAYSYLWLTP